jgi:sodium-dependent dicarboxylate transporter 2/3/5
MEKSQENTGERISFASAVSALAAIIAVCAFSLFFFEDRLLARAFLVAGVCLSLWLTEVVPPYVPTFILWALAALLLAPLSPGFSLAHILRWSADPVLLLFFGGFAFAVAAKKYGIDALIANKAVALAHGRAARLLIMTAFATALMSMWMSNIAAAAMMIAALAPLVSGIELAPSTKKALYLAVAVGANFGGIATPIGTGPNAIAISALASQRTITFSEWMTFSLPLALGLILLGVAYLVIVYKVKGKIDGRHLAQPEITPKGKLVMLIFCATIAVWLAEPLHGISSFVVALLAAIALFGAGLLGRKDLNSIDWGTMALIAGGVGLGRLLEASHLVKIWADGIAWDSLSPVVQVFALCLACATLSALLSNTATATMLIPLASGLMPDPKIAVLVAISASLGTPFVISTPINIMVHGKEGVRAKDLFWLGFPLMILGCLLLAFTGRYFLSFWL